MGEHQWLQAGAEHMFKCLTGLYLDEVIAGLDSGTGPIAAKALKDYTVTKSSTGTVTL